MIKYQDYDTVVEVRTQGRIYLKVHFLTLLMSRDETKYNKIIYTNKLNGVLVLLDVIVN